MTDAEYEELREILSRPMWKNFFKDWAASRLGPERYREHMRHVYGIELVVGNETLSWWRW